MYIEVMVYSRQSLLWAAILCCAANAEPLVTALNGTSRALLTTSSTTSLPQQYVSPSSTTTLPSTSSKLSSLPSSSVPTSISVMTFQPSSSSAASIVTGPLPPPPISYNASTAQTSLSDGGNVPDASSLPELTGVGGVAGNKLSLSPTSANVASNDGASTPTRTASSPTAIQTSSETGSLGSPGSPVTLQPPTTALALAPPSTQSLPNNGFPLGGLPITTNPPAPHLSPSVLNNVSSQEPVATSKFSSMHLNSTLTISLTSKHHNSSTAIRSSTISPYLNVTTKIKPTHEPTTTHHHKNTSSGCIPYTPGEIVTVWSVVPNTNTVTITLYSDQSNTYTSTPEFTPPVTCIPPSPESIGPSVILPFGSASLWLPFSESSTLGIVPHETSVAASAASPPSVSTDGNFRSSRVTTIVITSKNPVTQFTTQTDPRFPGGGVTQKQGAPGTSTNILGPPPSPTGGAVSPITSITNIGGSDGIGGLQSLVGSDRGRGSPTSIAEIGPPSTVNVGGVTVVVGPGSVAIGTVIVMPGSGGGLNTVVTQGGETFTVNPSQVIGPGTVISIPTSTASNGGVFMEAPTSTVINGVSVAVGDGVAVVGGSTFDIGAGAPQETILVNKDEISIGPGGVGFADITITPAASLPTNVVIFDGKVFSVVGASVAVFDGSSFTFTGGTPQTTIFNGDTITAGLEGFVDGTSTLGGPSHPTGTQFGLAGGIAISEIGSTIAVIDGTTLTVGPGAAQTTATIEGHTITAGPSGLNIGGANGGSTTLNFPFNPTTQAVTAGGITFSEIGSSLVNVGGTTFSIGPGATPTTDVYNGQTISIGPGGVGFATTTITSFTTSSLTPTNGKKNGAAALRPLFGGVLGPCIALGVGILV